MPGLLDLPPELFEQIFDKCEEVAYEVWCAEKDEDDYWPPRAGVPPSRSTCRYIERATCRRFAKIYLGDGPCQIAAKDADIEKFCAQAKVEGFDANETLLLFGFDNDISAKASLKLEPSGLPNSAQSSGNTASLVIDTSTGALVPSHLYRNRDAIVEALRACSNLAEFRFSKNWGDGTKYPTNRRCLLAALDEGEPNLFDITSSVAYVLSLAAKAGTRLERILVSDAWPDVQVGLSDRASLVTYKAFFQNLKYLGPQLIADPSMDPEEAGARLGKQISEALTHMPTLQHLNLEFVPAISIAAWIQIANGPTITLSTLKELNLRGCDMNVCDFSKMISNMISLTRLGLSDVDLYKGFRDDLAQVFLGLANGPCELEIFTLHFGGLFMGEEEEIVFPSSLHKPDALPLDSEGEIEDEGELIEVVIQPWIHWKGKAGIEWVLREMAAHIQSL